MNWKKWLVKQIKIKKKLWLLLMAMSILLASIFVLEIFTNIEVEKIYKFTLWRTRTGEEVPVWVLFINFYLKFWYEFFTGIDLYNDLADWGGKLSFLLIRIGGFFLALSIIGMAIGLAWLYFFY